MEKLQERNINNTYSIIVPGLGNGVKNFNLATKHWNKYGFKVKILDTPWKSKNFTFENLMHNLNDEINKNYENNKIVLIGTSAGGSAVINGYLKNKDKVEKVITVCSRLKVGPKKGFRSFNNMTKSSFAFAKSVIESEKNLLTINAIDRSKILTFKSTFGDELVPSETSIIDGVKNINILIPEHVLCIAYVILFSKKLIKFLQ